MTSIINLIKPALVKLVSLELARGLLFILFAWLLQLGMRNAECGIVLFMALVLRIFIELFLRRILNELAVDIKLFFRSKIHQFIFAQKLSVGELLSSVFEEAEALGLFIVKVLPNLLSLVTLLPAVLVAALIVDPLSALILLIVFPVAPIILWLIGNTLKAKNNEASKTLQVLNASFFQCLSATTTFKLFNVAGDSYIENFSKRQANDTLSLLKFVFISSFALELLTTLSIAILAVTVGLRLVEGDVDFQVALFLLILAPDFFNPIRQLGASYHLFINAKEALRNSECGIRN